MSLEQELRALAVDFPPEPELAPGVLARLERPEPRRQPRWLVPALAVVASVAALLAIPQTRAAILRLLEIGGVRVERVETQPLAPARAPALGREVTLEQARSAVGFPLAIPSPRAGVFLDGSVPGGMVSFRWDGLVLSQWRGEQLPLLEKHVGPASSIEHVDVAGVPGVWIAGARHELVYLDAEGEPRVKTRRLVGNVLLWDRGGITYRLEGALARAPALELARNLSRP